LLPCMCTHLRDTISNPWQEQQGCFSGELGRRLPGLCACVCVWVGGVGVGGSKRSTVSLGCQGSKEGLLTAAEKVVPRHLEAYCNAGGLLRRWRWGKLVYRSACPLPLAIAHPEKKSYIKRNKLISALYIQQRCKLGCIVRLTCLDLPDGSKLQALFVPGWDSSPRTALAPKRKHKPRELSMRQKATQKKRVRVQ
jgi:hypothetical protein